MAGFSLLLRAGKAGECGVGMGTSSSTVPVEERKAWGEAIVEGKTSSLWDRRKPQPLFFLVHHVSLIVYSTLLLCLGVGGGQPLLLPKFCYLRQRKFHVVDLYC